MLARGAAPPAAHCHSTARGVAPVPHLSSSARGVPKAQQQPQQQPQQHQVAPPLRWLGAAPRSSGRLAVRAVLADQPLVVAKEGCPRGAHWQVRRLLRISCSGGSPRPAFRRRVARASPSARRRPPVALALAVFAASSSFCAHAATLLRN